MFITLSAFAKEKYVCSVQDKRGNNFLLTNVYFQLNADEKSKRNNFPKCKNGESIIDLNFDTLKIIEFTGEMDIPIKDYILANVLSTEGKENKIYFFIGKVKHRNIFGGMSKTIGNIITIEINRIKKIEFLNRQPSKMQL